MTQEDIFDYQRKEKLRARWRARQKRRMENPAFRAKYNAYQAKRLYGQRRVAGCRTREDLHLEWARKRFLDFLGKRARHLNKKPKLSTQELRERARLRNRIRRRRRPKLKDGKLLRACKATNDWGRFWHHRKKILVANRRIAARKNGVEFTVTAADLAWPIHCPVLGVKLNYTTLGKCFPESPSLDRIDPSKGYVPGNVAVISHRANTLKSNSSTEELEKILNYIKFAEFVTSMPVIEPKGFEDV